MLRARFVAILFVLMSVLASAMQSRERDAAWVAPVGAASKINPLANRAEAAGGGRKLFQQRCSTCHAEDGRGSTKAPDLTQPAVQGQSDGALFWKVSSGNTRQGMPSFSFLPELQRWQIVLHIRESAVRHDR